MSYTVAATSKTPALVIYLVDASASMATAVGRVSRVELLMKSFQKIAYRMIQRSTKGTIIASRYRIAIFAYNNQAIDILDGIKTISEVGEIGLPQFVPMGQTNTAAAFLAVEKLLIEEISNLSWSPAPLVCHITDGEYTGEDPMPIAKRIMELSVPDGNVLIENIFLGESLQVEPILRINEWAGISDESQLQDSYAKKLFHMSSIIPERHRMVMQEMGYSLKSGSRMMIPGDHIDVIDLGFSMSGATPITRSSR